MSSVRVDDEKDDVFYPESLLDDVGGNARPYRDPVMAADGHTYERASILAWKKKCDDLKADFTSPITHEKMPNNTLVANYRIIKIVEEFRTHVLPLLKEREQLKAQQTADQELIKEM